MTPSKPVSRATTEIEVAWELLIRVHGARTAREINEQSQIGDGPAALSLWLKLSESPQSLRCDVQNYFVFGEKWVAEHSPIPEQPRSIWLTVAISRKVRASTALVNAFKADPEDEPKRQALETALHQELDVLRQVADLYAGSFALAFTEAHPALWHDAIRVWHTEHDYKLTAVVGQAKPVEPRDISDDDLDAIAIRVASMNGMTGRARSALRLCSRWLITANDLAYGSNERFLLYFQCLEALSSLASAAQTPAELEGFRYLSDAVALLPSDDRTSAREYLNRLKERTAKPSLSELFRRLAERYCPRTADADVTMFRAINGARNAYIHAKSHSIPLEHLGVDIHTSVHDLLVKYFGAIVDVETAMLPAVMLRRTR